MTSKNFLFIVLVMLLSIAGVSAQGYQGLIRELGSSVGGQVCVVMDRTSTSAMEFRGITSTVPGYRICLFSGTDQNARSRANEAVSRLKELYPNLESKWLYDAPVFKVNCGAWLTRIEATLMLGKLKPSFASAFIIGERIALDELQPKSAELPVIEGTEIIEVVRGE